MNRPNITRLASGTSGSLAAALILCMMAVLPACTATDDEPVLSRAGTPLLEIRAGIDAPLTRASGTAWVPGDAIGISSENIEGEKRYNIKYITEKGDGVFIPAHPDTTIIIPKGGDVTTTLSAYYPFTGESGRFPSQEAEIKHTITSADQTPDRQPFIDYLYAMGTTTQSNMNLQFRHKMSRIVLNFEAGDGLDRLADMTCTLGPLKTGGSFYPITGNAEADITISAQEFSILLPSGTTTASLLFYPQTLSGVTIPFRIEMNGETYTTSGLAFDNNGLESGNEYIFNITVSDHRVTISSSSNGSWIHKEDTEDITSTPL